MTELDKNNEGIIATEDLKEVLREQVQDLKSAELHLVLRELDKQNRGVLSINALLAKC